MYGVPQALDISINSLLFSFFSLTSSNLGFLMSILEKPKKFDCVTGSRVQPNFHNCNWHYLLFYCFHQTRELVGQNYVVSLHSTEHVIHHLQTQILSQI